MGNDLRDLLEALKAQGFSVQRTTKGNWIITRDGKFVAAMASTPADWRAMRNNIAAIRRAGLIWPRKR